MNSSGIMQDIREMLSQGRSVPEIIDEGYSASTVYRVQRDTRKKSGILGETRRTGTGSNRGADYWVQLIAENLMVEKRVALAESQLAELTEIWSRVEEIEEALEESLEEQRRLTEVIRNLEPLVRRADAELEDLAKVYQEGVWLGDPKWRRRTG